MSPVHFPSRNSLGNGFKSRLQNCLKPLQQLAPSGAKTLRSGAPLEMDPLSISVSAITIATVASQIVKNLIQLRALIGSRRDILLLSNEVSDLELVLMKISSAAKAVSSCPAQELLSLPGSLASAGEKVNALNALIESYTGQKPSASIRKRLKHWLKEDRTLERLQQEVRDIRCRISLELVVVS